MPSTGTHRYENLIVPITRGTVVVNGTLTLPTTGQTTFNLGADIYGQKGIYTLISFTSLAGGTVPTNFAVNGAALVALGFTVGTPVRVGNTIQVTIS